MNSNRISLSARWAAEALGANIRTARLKRRFSVKDFSRRVGASESTILRLERGDTGVSIGTLAMACLALGEIDRITQFLDAGTDGTGLLLDREALPKRIRRRQGTRPPGAAKGQSVSGEVGGDEEGVGF